MNEVFYTSETHYLSYMSKPSPLTLIMEEALYKGNPNIGKNETAICIREPWKCLILYGDHRDGYEPIKEDLEKCKEYWTNRPLEMGHSTDTLD